MSKLYELEKTPEYQHLQALQKEREELENQKDSGLLFLGYIGMFKKKRKKKEREKRIAEIDKELTQHQGLMEQIKAAEQEEQAARRKELVEDFEQSEYANGYIIVYGRATHKGGNAWDSFEEARIAYTQKFGANNGYRYKDIYQTEEFVATISVDGEPVARTDKDTVFYKIPVSDGLHSISFSGYGQLSVGGRLRFDDSEQATSLDLTTGSKFVLFDCIIRPVSGKAPQGLLQVTSYDDFGLFAEDMGINDVSDLEQ